MLINNIHPNGALKEYIRFYRIIHFKFDHSEAIANTKAYRPRIEHCLQFTPFDMENVHYQDGKVITENAAVFGQHTLLNHRTVGRNYLNFQVVFRPGLLYQLLRLHSHEITNIYMHAENLFGREVHLVNEQLLFCRNYESMIEVVEAYLLNLISKLRYRRHPCDRVAMQMLNPYDTRSIEWYAGQSNLCYRQFDRAFKDSTGITPKEYSNLVRLDLAYLLKNRAPERDWLSIAVECGFYDYQHLSKEYKRYTGYTPVDFFKLEQKAPERHFGYFER